MNHILLTGGKGKLGTELQKLKQFFAPPHRVFDIVKATEAPPVDMVVHAAAYTGVESAETNRMKCFETNVTGTLNLLNLYPNTPFVYISSEYAHKPVNFYGLTKSLAEQLVTYHSAPYLIIRTLFKPVPFPYPKAFIDAFTLGDEITIIAPLIIKLLDEWDKKSSKLVYCGTGRKSIYDIAVKSNPNVGQMVTKDIKGVIIPTDYK